MNGRYLIVENEKQEELLYFIADFLWNHGNEVIVQNNFQDIEYYHLFLNENPCVIIVNEENFSVTENILKKIEQKTDNMIIHFSKTGVYTNVIPFPHKIFQFERLCKSELNCFFYWCKKLNLFENNRVNQNIFFKQKYII